LHTIPGEEDIWKIDEKCYRLDSKDAHHQGHQFIVQSARRDQRVAAKFVKKKDLLVTLPAASLPEPDTVDFGAVRAAREVVICSMAEKMLEWSVKTRFDNA
jgi:hypothetical protein